MTVLNVMTERLSRDDLGSEDGFTLMELVIVMLILGIVSMIAIPTYIGFTQSAEQASAKTNVAGAIAAAESIDASAGSYYYGSGTTLTGADLRIVSTGVGSNVKATALNGGKGYCIEDTEAIFTYSYIGGVVTSGTVGVLQPGSCLTDAGTAAS